MSSCLSETNLSTSIPDNLIDIEGYKLIRADHSHNVKRGGVCIYYKESLPVRVISLPCFKEALLMISVICRSPSQNNDKFHTFLSNFVKLLNHINNRKPSLSVVTGDFNSRCSSWWSNNINTTEELNLFSLTFSNGSSQLINEPTQ